jgi:hypothetical protein
MLPSDDGANINGPSLIKVPRWIHSPLGRYYLYFAHHKGSYIRLAYADSLAGPWQVYTPGTLALRDCPFAEEHIASPDVHVDNELRRIVMYFHGPVPGDRTQRSFVATSAEGLAFVPRANPLGPPYARVFRHDGWHYGLFGTGKIRLLRSRDGMSNFAKGPLVFPEYIRDKSQPRHLAVHKSSARRLDVFYTIRPDMPERILRGSIDLSGDWTSWHVRGGSELIRPREPYEGANLPLRLSKKGAAKSAENALRDPGIFHEDGRTWLLYAVAGETGIALAEIGDGSVISDKIRKISAAVGLRLRAKGEG